MDKCLALTYFVRAADSGSFAAAARALNVSTPSVHRLITSLEQQRGVTLFTRTTTGLVLTHAGTVYLNHARQILAAINTADTTVSLTTQQASGTLLLYAHPELMALPWLHKWHYQYPEITLLIRPITRPRIPETNGDAYLVHGWPQFNDYVIIELCRTRMLTCASPRYWERFGTPSHPNDLTTHTALNYENDEGVALDAWPYERNHEKVIVKTSGWMIANDRRSCLSAGLAGEGVLRIPDIMVEQHIKSGRLVSVLNEWTVPNSPPIHYVYHGDNRSNPRIAIMLDYLRRAFLELQEETGFPASVRPPSHRPFWYHEKAPQSLKRASDHIPTASQTP